MIRFGADILALASDAQQNVLNTIDKCVRLTRQDGQPHDGTLAFAGAWGHPTVFIGSRRDTHLGQSDSISRRTCTSSATS